MRIVKCTPEQRRMVEGLMKAIGEEWPAAGMCCVGSDEMGWPVDRTGAVIEALAVMPQLGWPKAVVHDLIHKVLEESKAA